MSYIGKQPAESALTAGDITDGVVTTVKLADDAVTAAKVADGIIVNAAVSSAAAIDDTKIAPPYYAAVANLPTAGDHHGRVAHAHSEGKMYYSHGGSWIALAKDSDLPTGPALLAADQVFTGQNRGGITALSNNTNTFDLTNSGIATNNFSVIFTTGSPALNFTIDANSVGQSGNIVFVNGDGSTSATAFSAGSTFKIASADLTTLATAGTYWMSYICISSTQVLVTISAKLI